MLASLRGLQCIKAYISFWSACPSWKEGGNVCHILTTCSAEELPPKIILDTKSRCSLVFDRELKMTQIVLSFTNNKFLKCYFMHAPTKDMYKLHAHICVHLMLHHVCTTLYIHTYRYIFMCVCMHVCEHMYVCIYIHMHELKAFKSTWKEKKKKET